jgi:hypothetical protein
LVETPEERRVKAVSEAMNEADGVQLDPVSYVLIPADTSLPLREFSFVPKSVGGDGLVTHLKSAFSGNSDKVDMALLLQQNHNTIGSSETLPTVSEDTLKEVAKEGHVEVFALVHPAPSNKFVGINMYLDEVGLLKRLKTNTRASDFAKQAGYNPAPTFCGNIFLGRVRKTGNLMENADFQLNVDAAPNADWLRKAATENLEYQMEMNQITGSTATQAAVDGTEGVCKEEVGYSWTQSEEEMELVVPLPSSDVKSKEVQVKFKPQSVLVTCRKETLLDLELFERVDVDGCTWTLDRQGDKLNLAATMEKLEQAMWPRIRN